MFDHRRAAAGVAVLSGVAATLGVSPASATPAAPSEGGDPLPDRFCAVAAVSPEEYVPGEPSPVACGPTREEAHARLRRAAPARANTFAAASSFARGDLLLGIEYESPRGPGLREWDIWHPTCNALYNSAFGWETMIHATELVSCSVTKLYTGRDATGQATEPIRTKGVLGLWPPFKGNVRSVTFGSS